MRPDLDGRSLANDPAIVQDQHPVSEGKGLLLGMRDINRGDIGMLQQIPQFIQQIFTQRPV